MALDKDIIDLSFISSLDGSQQRALWYRSPQGGCAPLLVGLHTWSYDRFNQLDLVLPFCRERGWSLLLPEFRGPNLKSNVRPRDACASPLARQDVFDAIDLVGRHYGFDQEALFLLGGSGGGHMALMLAAQQPDLWTAVSSWVPITDLASWHQENPDYADHVEACCGGAPGADPETDREYRERSPLSYLPELSRIRLSVHHGRFDPIVSYRHTMNLVAGLERLKAEHFFFEVFDGGHDIRYDVAFSWFDRLRNAGSGQEFRLTG